MPPEYETLVFAGASVGFTLYLSSYLIMYVIKSAFHWMKEGSKDESENR